MQVPSSTSLYIVPSSVRVQHTQGERSRDNAWLCSPGSPTIDLWSPISRALRSWRERCRHNRYSRTRREILNIQLLRVIFFTACCQFSKIVFPLSLKMPFIIELTFRKLMNVSIEELTQLQFVVKKIAECRLTL